MATWLLKENRECLEQPAAHAATGSRFQVALYLYSLAREHLCFLLLAFIQKKIGVYSEELRTQSCALADPGASVVYALLDFPLRRGLPSRYNCRAGAAECSFCRRGPGHLILLGEWARDVQVSQRSQIATVVCGRLTACMVLLVSYRLQLDSMLQYCRLTAVASRRGTAFGLVRPVCVCMCVSVFDSVMSTLALEIHAPNVLLEGIYIFSPLRGCIHLALLDVGLYSPILAAKSCMLLVVQYPRYGRDREVFWCTVSRGFFFF